MKIINNVKKLVKLSSKSKTKDLPYDVRENAKSKFYLQETSLGETDDSQIDFERLFNLLKQDLKKMTNAHESLLKYKESITQTFNLIQIDEISKDDLSIKIQSLKNDSQLCIDSLAQQEIISEIFVFNSFKLYDSLNKYEKSLNCDSVKILKKERFSKKRQSITLQRPVSRDFDEYYDTRSQFSDRLNITYSSLYHQSSVLENLNEENSSQSSESNLESIALYKPKRLRRTEIPVKPSNSNVKSLMTFLKNVIGKDVTRMPLPASFWSEPISFLQRNAESLEYSHLLDRAAECTDSLEQIGFVAAFCVSEFSTFYDRKAKPFNPLLNETFEFDREDDLGWRLISEQVCHHPPHFAVHVESKRDWKLEFDTTVTTKFKGHFIEAQPSGIVRLTFKSTGNYYTWSKIKTYINGLLYGKIWISNQGNIQIENHKTKEKCIISFHEPSYFSKELTNKITGIVMDKNSLTQYVLEGNCTELIERSKVLTPSYLEVIQDFKKLNLGPSEILWKRVISDSKYKLMYNFTQFTVQMNEMEPNIAPTDSRLRPDQRLMEDGNFNEADSKKVNLEEKQRTKLKQFDIEPEPIWFKKEYDPVTKEERYMFTDEYWECKRKQDWSKSPQIF